jgi:ABC-type uncharacterized transport system, permease component
MLRIYRRMWAVNWSEQWQYRANLMMYLFYWLVSPIVYLAVWTTVAREQGSVGGLTANDFITYYLTLLIVDTLTSEITIHLVAYKIQDGTLSGDLLKPIHPILTHVLVNNLAFKALTLIALVPIWLVLGLLFAPDFSGVTIQSLLLAVPAIALGFAVSFLLGATITCVAFSDYPRPRAERVLLRADRPLLRPVCTARSDAAPRAGHRPIPALPAL